MSVLGEGVAKVAGLGPALRAPADDADATDVSEGPWEQREEVPKPPRRMVSVPPGTSIVSSAKTAEVYVVEVMVEL